MSESPTPDVAENTAQPHSQALTPEAIDAVLADFRAWLSALPESPAVPPLVDEPPDLHTLLAQFTALRHEVNLQTKATRAQQEQNSETLRQLTLALEALEQARENGQQTQQNTADERLRPLLKALMELHDAVALAGREMARVQDAALPGLGQILDVLSAEEGPLKIELEFPSPPPQSWWSRWFGSPAPVIDRDALNQRLRAELHRHHDQQRERAQQAGEALERIRQLLASLATGYTMSLQRVERTLRQHGLEPINTVGQPFDPEQMEVVEAVTSSGKPAGEVLDEVRRGYLLNGRVFRFAQVRVAKS